MPLDAGTVARFDQLAARIGGRVTAGLRPEAISDAALEPEVPGDRVVDVSVELVEALGADIIVHGVLGTTRTTARFTPRSRVRPGDTVKVAIDIDALHLFDADTGRSLRSVPPPPPVRP